MRHKVRKVMRITPQTDYHLKMWAASCGRDEGWVIDKLVRDRAMMLKGRTDNDNQNGGRSNGLH